MTQSRVDLLVQRIGTERTCVSRRPDVLDTVRQALEILAATGIPIASVTPRRAEKTAFALLALADVPPGGTWSAVPDVHSRRLTTRQIIRWAGDVYGDNRSASSYDYVLRDDLDPMLRMEYVHNTGRLEGKSHNDSTRAYGLDPSFAELVRTFGSRRWKRAVASFMRDQPALEDRVPVQRHVAMEVESIDFEGNPVIVGLGPGPHNELVKASVEQFLPRFGRGARLLYLGDADDRDLYRDDDAFRNLGIEFEDVLPDVVALSAETGWMFIIEAFHSRGPVSHSKHLRLSRLLASYSPGIVYVTTFADRRGFRSAIPEIAWETEVWLADEPDHLIHFNGDRFLGPHSGRSRPR